MLFEEDLFSLNQLQLIRLAKKLVCLAIHNIKERN